MSPRLDETDRPYSARIPTVASYCPLFESCWVSPAFGRPVCSRRCSKPDGEDGGLFAVVAVEHLSEVPTALAVEGYGFSAGRYPQLSGYSLSCRARYGFTYTVGPCRRVVWWAAGAGAR